jgi:hypothetical protein
MVQMVKRWGGRILTIGSVIAMVMLMLPGCQPTRPDFSERSHQDCEHGDQEACRMLVALNPSKAGEPAPVRPPPPRRPTPVQSDVQAIMKGMGQARSSPKAGYQEDRPPP